MRLKFPTSSDRGKFDLKSMAWIMRIIKFCNTAGRQQWLINSQNLTINSSFYMQHVSNTFSSENLIHNLVVKYNMVDIPHSSHFTSAWNCIDTVRRNSYLVTLEYAAEVFWIQLLITCTVMFQSYRHYRWVT